MNIFADIVLSYLDPTKCSHEQLFDRNVFLTCKNMAKSINKIKMTDCNYSCNVTCTSCKLYGRKGCKNCICLTCFKKFDEIFYKTISHITDVHPMTCPTGSTGPIGLIGCRNGDKEKKKKRYSKLCHNFPKPQKRSNKY